MSRESAKRRTVKERSVKLKEFGDLIERKVKKSLDKIEEVLKDDLLKKDNVLDRGLGKLEEILNDDLFKEFKVRAARRDERRRAGDEEPGPFKYLELLLRDRFVATVSPSSKFVIRRVLKAMDLRRVRAVVEYGPADGVITKQILPHLPRDAKLIAIERNADFFSRLAKIKDPRFHPVHGDVRDVAAHLKRFSVDKADCIVSGIPFSYLAPKEREDLLAWTADRLNPGGRFVAYQVTTHLIPLLKKHFRDVDIEFEIRNIPPHFVFTAFK